MSPTAVRLDRVSKRFRLGESHDTLRDLVMERFFRRRRDNAAQATLWAVRDVSFDVPPGDAVGIIGPNGAGKSTILKLLAGIHRPDAGRITKHGRLAALIEVGAGFHGDLTGRENVFLSGAILGMTRREVRSKLDAIVAFAGLERFLDTPVKRYSSGMYARLGFSIAAHVEPDILLVDEVLSVGDAVFRLRCLDRMRQLIRRGTTLVFVTHDLEQMQATCPRAIVLEQGHTAFEGAAPDAVGHYMKAMSRRYAERPADLTAADTPGESMITGISLRFYNHRREEFVWTRSNCPVRAVLGFTSDMAIDRAVIELNMRTGASQNLISINSGRDEVRFRIRPGPNRTTLALPGLPVGGGQYLWNVRIWDAESGRALADTPFSFPLIVTDDGPRTGLVSVSHEWMLESEADAAATAIGTGVALNEAPRPGLAHSPHPMQT
jgi:ABC-type polysaccharide/polyol phosphate transport system ATPase subunit